MSLIDIAGLEDDRLNKLLQQLILALEILKSDKIVDNKRVLCQINQSTADIIKEIAMRIIGLILILFSCEALALELPVDWRLPTEKEMTTESPLKQARIESDFNQDGKLDHAFLLKSVNYPGEGLVVYVSTATGYEWQILDRVEWGEEYAEAGLKMRIKIARPGRYNTACALGYWTCGPEEPAVLELKQVAIYQNRFDGAIAIWFWDKGDNQFKKIWLGTSGDR